MRLHFLQVWVNALSYINVSGIFTCAAYVDCNYQVILNNMIYILFAGWEVRIVKNCDRGLENAAWGCGWGQHFQVKGHSFSLYGTNPKPVNNLFICFQALKRKKKNSQKKTHASVTETVVRDRKIRTVLRTNQIAVFVSLPAWKKTNIVITCTAHIF